MKYEKPTVAVIEIESEDIIRTSNVEGTWEGDGEWLN